MHYRGLLFTLCRRYSGHGVEVDDLMQDIAITLWQQRERLLSMNRGAQQAAWVWKVARNAAIDSLRRVRATESLPDNWEMADEERSHIDALHEHIEQLPEPDRTLVNLHLQGYSYREIGQQLMMTEKNVSVRLVRIKDKLRKEMST